MKALYLESVGGIAGDMFTASFLDAGIVDLREMGNILEILDLPDVTIHTEQVRRRGIPCTYFNIRENSDRWKSRFHFRDDGQLRMYEILEYLRQKTLESQTMRLAIEILMINASARVGRAYRSSGAAARQAGQATPESAGQAGATGLSEDALSSSENTTRSISAQLPPDPSSLDRALDENDPALQALYAPEEVVDLIVDCVFAAHCVRRSEATAFYASPLRSGGGEGRGQRNPQHPTAELFRDLPVLNLKASIGDALRELSTPTGLSIIRALEPEFLPNWPEGRVRFMGTGAGTYESEEFANTFRVLLLDRAVDPGLYSAARKEPEGAVLIQYDVRCGINPDKPEKMATLMDSLERQGARDVRLYQRKDTSGKPGFGLAFLCNEDDLTSLSDYLLTNTTAFGIRYEKLRGRRAAPGDGDSHSNIGSGSSESSRGGSAREMPFPSEDENPYR